MDNSIVYTDGVQYFAQNPGDQGTYWLLDMMMFDLIPHNRNEEFLVIEVDVKENQTISGLKRVPPFFVFSIRSFLNGFPNQNSHFITINDKNSVLRKFNTEKLYCFLIIQH